LLEGAEACSEQGWLEVEKAKRCAGAPARHEAHATAALALARELPDRDPEAAALAQVRLALVDGGDVHAGLGVLDER
jgi:hypothetical protein